MLPEHVLPRISLERRLAGRLFLEAHASHASYRSERQSLDVPDVGPIGFTGSPPTFRQSATFISLGLGLKWMPVISPRLRVRPFIGLLPALFVAHLTETMTSPDRQDSFTAVVGGYELEAGLRGSVTDWLALDAEVHDLHSRSFGYRALGVYDRGEYEGPSAVAYTMAATWTR
jgi:hypothetical protein